MSVFTCIPYHLWKYCSLRITVNLGYSFASLLWLHHPTLMLGLNFITSMLIFSDLATGAKIFKLHLEWHHKHIISSGITITISLCELSADTSLPARMSSSLIVLLPAEMSRVRSGTTASVMVLWEYELLSSENGLIYPLDSSWTPNDFSSASVHGLSWMCEPVCSFL